jgi:chromosome segregation ATPase
MFKSAAMIEIAHKKKQLTKRKATFQQNELAQLSNSIRMEGAISKLTNKTQVLSMNLEDNASTIQMLTKENQRLRSELLKYTVEVDQKEQEMFKTVSKESQQLSRLTAEREELRNEVKELKSNLREEILHFQQLQSQFEQIRRQADAKERKLFSELAIMEKQMEEERQATIQLVRNPILYYKSPIHKCQILVGE